MAVDYQFPVAYKHGKIERLFDNIYFVTGSLVIKSKIPMRFSRNMTIIKQGNELTLINSVRLNDEGLKKLDELGVVKHVIRLAGFHGMDDPFYKDRYAATIWSVDAPYVAGFDQINDISKRYFTPDHILSDDTELPIDNAKLLYIKSSNPKEALLFLQRNSGIIVSGDCLQNWAKADHYFSFFAAIMMKLMGFIKPYNIGPGWLKYAKPDVNELKQLLNIQYDHVLPAHGKSVIGAAKSFYQPKIDSL